MKKVLSIAGSDCSGGAGIQNISADMIGKQIDAVFEDIEVDAVKVDILSTPDCMEEVAGKLKYYHPANIVVDPVMYAKNGCPLMEPVAIETLIGTVIPLADVLTPNIPEAEKITGGRIRTLADMEEAAKAIRTMRCRAVVIKGGHAARNAVDVLFDGKEICHFDTARIDTKNMHGTGCNFLNPFKAEMNYQN